jgi:hypothetical protein
LKIGRRRDCERDEAVDVLVRHRVADKDRPGGKKLIDVPGYLERNYFNLIGADCQIAVETQG